jgi:HSP20 family protein
MSLLMRRYGFPFDTIRREMARVMGEDWPFMSWMSSENIYPPANVYDAPEAAIVEFEVPGVAMNDMELTVTGGSVTLKVTRSVEGDVPPEKYYVRERWRGEFGRTVTVPGSIDSAAAKAALKNGILTVTIPKKAQARPRKIEVKVA